MSDANTSLPIRTQNNGDAKINVADGTVTSQLLKVNADGSVNVEQSTASLLKATAYLNDGSGDAITSQVNGSARALDVGINVAGVQVDPRAIRALTAADVVTAQQGTTPWITSDLADGSVAGGAAGTKSLLAGAIYNSTAPTLTAGQQASLQLDSAGNLKVDLITSLPTGANTIGNIGTVASITGALPTGTNTIGSVNQGTTPWVTSDLADGSVTGGAAGTKSLLGGGIYNSTAPTLTTGQQASLQLDASGNLDVNLKTAIPAGTNLIGAVNLDVGGSAVSATNPVPVSITTTTTGTAVQDYHTSAALAVGSSTTFTYTVAASHTFNFQRAWASASGKIKVVVAIGASTAFVGFNSTATPNVDITVISPPLVAAAGTVTITITNLDILPQDVYATIEGNQN